MRKHKKLLVIALAAILVLTIGLTTTAFASGQGNGDTNPVQTFISKVAGILGLGEEQVADAFDQARQEMRDEALEQRLQKAVENRCITEEEAAGIREWWQNRPEALERFGPRSGLQPGHACRYRACERLCEPGWDLPRLARVFDECLNGTITDVTENAITLEMEDGTEVTIEYTSNTTFVLNGATAVEDGQAVTALCWEDADGELTAKVVRVELP